MEKPSVAEGRRGGWKEESAAGGTPRPYWLGRRQVGNPEGHTPGCELHPYVFNVSGDSFHLFFVVVVLGLLVAEGVEVDLSNSGHFQHKDVVDSFNVLWAHGDF